MSLRKGTLEDKGRLRLSMEPSNFCVGEARVLLPLAEEIFKLRFSEEPYYEKYQFMLKKTLLLKNVVPNPIFEWSIISPPAFLVNDDFLQSSDQSVDVEDAEEYFLNDDDPAYAEL